MAKDEKAEENIMKGKFLGRFVIEIIGKPKDHVIEVMNKYIENLKEDQDLEFEKVYIAEPEEKGNAFSTYAELEIWIKGIQKLFAFCLDAMPSSVEILAPGNFVMQSADFNSLLNDLQAKMHEVDLAVKDIRARNTILEKNATTLMQNIVMLALHKTPKTPEQLEHEIGIKADKLKNVLDKMVKDNFLKLVDEKWYATRGEDGKGGR